MKGSNDSPRSTQRGARSTKRSLLLMMLAAVTTLLAALPAFAGSDAEQFARFKDPNQWGARRQSQSDPLQRAQGHQHDNVKDLQMSWAQSTGALRGHEGQPLVIDIGGKPMMIFISGCPDMSKCNIVQALDLSDPDHPVQAWSYMKTTGRDESAVPRACCDTVNRGGSYADGKFVFGTLDGYVIALDAATGKEAWVVKHAHPDKGETITPAPIIANDKVFIGFGGDEFAARGRFTAYALADGKKVWECYSNGSDKDVGLTRRHQQGASRIRHRRQGSRHKTYPGDEWQRGGGAAWGWYAYDPDLHLVYYATGNPGLWSPSFRCGAKPQTQEACNNGSSTTSGRCRSSRATSIPAKVAWVYQMTPFDQWDYDGINEVILVDNIKDVDGKAHKALVEFDRNGFAYVLDRTDGTLLHAHKYVTANWAEKVDMKTGRPVKVAEHSPLLPQQNVQACPSAMGGKDQQPASVDPADPANFYVPTNNWCMELNPQERSHTQQGTVYVFANVYMYPEKPGITGKLKKFNVVTGKTEWEIPDQYPNWGGTLTTAGGLVFYGSLGGDFRAVDRNTGKVVWSRKLAPASSATRSPTRSRASSTCRSWPASAAGSACRLLPVWI